MDYIKAGKITHYFDKIQVGVLEVTNEPIKVGDTIRVGEADNGFEQTVESLQVDHNAVNEVGTGKEAGLKLNQAAKAGDVVYKVSL